MSINHDFMILDIARKNYLDCTQDIQKHVDAQGLDAIYEEEDSKVEVTHIMNTKAIILLLRHLSNTIKSEFITIMLWDSLKDPFDYQNDNMAS